MPTTLIDHWKTYIRENRLLSETDRILAGISGGIDSMVMLDLLVKSGYQVSVAHCNFQLRGTESDGDQKLVQEQCAAYGIPLFETQFDTLSQIESSGESLQMVARKLRYTWFDEIRIREGFDRIAIAHNADDSVETFFINLLRGTGLKGLTGIASVNGQIIRPLLFASRRDIVEYARTNQISYREDSSNASTKYVRNKLRLGLIPKFREIAPEFGPTMIENIERLSETAEFVASTIARFREAICQTNEQQTTLELDKLPTDYSLEFVVYELLVPFGFNSDTAHALVHAYTEGESGRKFQSTSFTAYLDRGKIIVRPTPPAEILTPILIESLENAVAYAGQTLSLELHEREDLETLKQPAQIALVDATKIAFPLTLRPWEKGDQFVPFGMTGKKKISDYLIDAKIPRPDKGRQLLVLSGGEIVWLVGHRIDDHYKITDKTRQYLRLEVK